MIEAFLLVMLGFWAGAIPFGVLIARRRGVDIREHGSGNIGATNVTRVLGPAAGAIVLLLDAAKGALPVWYALHHTPDPWLVVGTGGAALLGHCFSPFLEFKGGKGVATATGVFAVLVPQLVLLGLGVFVVVLRLSRVPALGSLAAVATVCIGTFVQGAHYVSSLALATFALLVYTHRTNLAKLAKPDGR
jgi:acyl phosphate:glycerol-3-phosphate acyltransferase